MKLVLLASLVIVVSGCATQTRQTDHLVKDSLNLPQEGQIKNVPHIMQDKNHCGPAAMAMVLRHKDKDVSAGEMAGSMMIKNLPGTFQADMLLEARRQGMLTFQLTSLQQILTEVSQGHPVIVFQNLGLAVMPRWHYSVVTGYDLKGPDIFLHTGSKKHHKTDMRFFERSWLLGEKWALLVLKPTELSSTASELDHVKAVSYLEGEKYFSSAQKGYQSILEKWPRSLSAHIGLGNVSYQLGQKDESIFYLKRAVRFHPQAAIAWHNLATVQGELGKAKEARESTKKALEFSSEETREQFRTSLKNYL